MRKTSIKNGFCNEDLKICFYFIKLKVSSTSRTLINYLNMKH